MNSRITRIICAVAAMLSAVTARAQSQTDEEEVRRMLAASGAAFARHDAHQAAQFMAENVDFVNVGAFWIHGRPDYETFHMRLFQDRFKDAVVTPLKTVITFLRPDIAVVHSSWSMTGDKNPDGSLRKPRFGLMTSVVEKRDGKWLIVVAQNTNSAQATIPEADGIVPPIAVPLSH